MSGRVRKQKIEFGTGKPGRKKGSQSLAIRESRIAAQKRVRGISIAPDLSLAKRVAGRRFSHRLTRIFTDQKRLRFPSASVFESPAVAAKPVTASV
jgi:hypothetical protein